MANKVIGDYLPAATIDGSTHFLLIQPGGAATAYNKINRNVFLGITGQPMDISTTQSVTNKTFDNSNAFTIRDDRFTLQRSLDTTKQAKFDLSAISAATIRTYTLPNASSTLADISSAQTFTNKTLTAPVITNGSITGTTITTDAIVGQTSATSGTVYGLSIATGKVGTNGVVTASITDNAVTGSKLATSAIKLGYTQITSNFVTTSTSFTDVTSLNSTVTVPAGGRDVLITFFCGGIQSTSAGSLWSIAISEGATVLQVAIANQTTANYNLPLTFSARISAPSAGSHTYKIQASTIAGTLTLVASNAPATTLPGPAYILVEAI